MSFFYYNYYYDEEEPEAISVDTLEVWPTKPRSTPIPPELRRLQVTTLLVVCSVGVLIVMSLCGCMFYKNERILSRMPWRRRNEEQIGRIGSKRRRGLFGLPGPFGSQGNPNLTTMMGQGILMPGLYTVASQRPRPGMAPVFSPQAEAAKTTEFPTHRPLGSKQPFKESKRKSGELLDTGDTLQGVLSTGSSPNLRKANIPCPKQESVDNTSDISTGSVTSPEPQKKENVVTLKPTELKVEEKDFDTKFRFSKKFLHKQKRKTSDNTSTPDPEVGVLNTELTCLGGRL